MTNWKTNIRLIREHLPAASAGLAREALDRFEEWFLERERQREQPIAMRLPCERCGQLHIDEGEFATKPHHTHSCQHCGLTWRPAKEHTVGVQFIPGFKNDTPPPPTPSSFDEWAKVRAASAVRPDPQAAQRGGEPTSQGLGSQGSESRGHVFKDGDWVRVKNQSPPYGWTARIEQVFNCGVVLQGDQNLTAFCYIEPWTPVIGRELVRVKSVLGKPLEVPEYGLVAGVEHVIHGNDTRWCVSLNEGGQRALRLDDLEPHDPTPTPSPHFKEGDWVRPRADKTAWGHHLFRIAKVTQDGRLLLRGLNEYVFPDLVYPWTPKIDERVVIIAYGVNTKVDCIDLGRDSCFRVTNPCKDRMWFRLDELEPAPRS